MIVASDNALVMPIGERRSAGIVPGRRLVMGVRPEDLVVAPASSGAADSVSVPARIDLIEPLGNETLVHTTVGSHTLTARSVAREFADVGAGVMLGIAPGKVHWFDLGTGDRIE